MIGNKVRIKDCCICGEISEGSFPTDLQEIYQTSKRICIENPDFYVVPSVSPLVSGHTLIFVKDHITSMGDLPNSKLLDLSNIVKEVSDVLMFNFDIPLIFEHGARNIEDSACGINHAHIHVLPLENKNRKNILSRIKESYSVSEKGNLSKIIQSTEFNRSYLLYGDNIDEICISRNNHISSQHVRRIIASEIGLKHWDWRGLFGRIEFNNTLSAYSHK